MKTASKEGDYRVAAGAFHQIANYKDSASLADKCLEKAEECKNNEIYSKAMNLMNRGLESYYTDAISEFQKIRGWKDSDRQISRCSEAIAEIKAKEKAAKEEAERKAEEERLAAEKAARRARRFATVICVIAVLLAAGYFGYKKYVVPEQIYKTAVSLMNSESYEEAISAFNALDGYKDSESQINACWTAIYDRDYAAAAALMENGQYEEAISAFKATYGYKDSVAQIEACRTAIKDQQYEEAVSLKNSGKYEEAYTIFASLSGYKDVDSVIKNDKNIAAVAEAAKYKVGATLLLGTYEQDNNKSNGKEAIEWTVLANDGKKALLISKYALDTKPFHEENEKITWERCSLRSWLNGVFYNTAFNAEEKKEILKMSSSQNKDSKENTSTGNTMDDNIFLLSVTEAEKYFTSDESRKCVPTEYAIAEGAATRSDKFCWWWLQVPTRNRNDAADVNIAGAVDYSGLSVDKDCVCVRPAIWISLE